VTRKERYHLRDLAFNELHRHFGDDLYAVDLDFLEFTLCETGIKLVAIIEVKSEYAKLNFSRLQHRAQLKLSDYAGVPYFVVKYITPNYDVVVYPMNFYAKKFVPDMQEMSLLSYMKLLYEIRGKKCPDHIISNLTKHRIISIVREYKKQRLASLEEEASKLRRELYLNGKRC
jgi:hypothetical protein